MSTEALNDLFAVRGKTAVVTGGSRGIGLMIARGLVEAGVRVVISSRKADACEAAVAELSTVGDCVAVPADLSTRAGVDLLAAAVRERFDGQLHLLVNNAGVSWGAPLDEFPDSGWDKVLDTNVKAIFGLTTALLPELRATATPEDPARVINIGSVDGIRAPLLENYSYSASKAAVHMLTRHLGKRLASESITVNAIAPGPFESKMTAFMLSNPEGRAVVEQQVPLGRIGAPEDAIGTVLFLSSRAGAYLTGAVVPLDGGYSGCG
jgi:NAD(P)-dependent dehydrogenase (short-subunit alcohol dehydrogenase family)